MRGILGRNFVSCMLFLVAAGFWCSGVQAQTQAQTQTLVHFDLPAQPLARSLEAIGTATNTDVGFDAHQVAGFTAPAVKADLTLDDALIRVLTGTRLRPKHLDDHTVVITAAQSTTSNAAGNQEFLASAPAGQSTNAPPSGSVTDTPSRLLLAQTDTSVPYDAKKTDEDKSESKEGQNSSDQLQEVVVTGTHIAGGPPIGSPLITITAADISNSGYSTIGDVVRSIPQSFGGGENPGVVGANGSTNQSNASSASTVNLRGLGSDSTLTLIDGHRIAYDGYANGVDISVIPIAAIERVEILTDSASSIYGSDAVAGVANFILKSDYEGVQTTARVGAASDGGATERQVSQLLGVNWTGGNALLSYEHYGQNNLPASDRSFAADAGPTTLLPAQNRDSVFARARQDLSDRLSFYVDGLYSDRSAETAVSYSASGASPLYPSAATDTLFSVSSGLNAKLPGGWSASVDGTQSRGAVGLSSGTVEGGVTTPNPTVFYGNRTTSIEVQASGPLIELPSGPIRTALGTGDQTEAFYANSTGIGAYTPLTERHIKYGFGELELPLVRPDIERFGLERLELSASARFEDYSDFGGITTPKMGALYAPTRDLTLRASWGRAFRAPDLDDEFGARQLVAFPIGIVGGGSAPGAQALVTDSGNPSLQPEKANTWTAGFDFKPAWLDPLRISLTYFNIDYRNLIAEPIANIGEALSNPIYAPFVSLNPSLTSVAAVTAQSNYFQNFTGGLYNPSKVGAIVYDQFQNVAEEHIHGVDLTGDYRLRSAVGDFDISLNAAWLTLVEMFTSTSPQETISGTVFNPPKFKSRFGVNWLRGAWSAASYLNYVDSETDNTQVPSIGVSSWTTVDASVTYAATSWGGLLGGLHLTAAVQNLFNRNPPALNPATTYVPGLSYDSTNASPLGRFVSLTISENW